MAVNRIIVDVDTDEPIPNRTLNRLGKEAADWMQAVGLANRDDVNEQPTYTVHHHVSTDQRVCEPCVYAARDGKQ